MGMELSPQVQNMILQLQQLQQQAQALASQKMQVEIGIRETDMALEGLEKVPDDGVVYQSFGGLLIMSDTDKVKASMNERKESLNLRTKMLDKQEERIQKRSQELQQQVQAIIGGGGNMPSGG